MLNEMKNDLTTEIKSLIQLEVDKIVKKKKEEFNMIVLKLQERITALELEEDLEKYGQHVCIGIEDVPLSSMNSCKVYKKVGVLLKERSLSCIVRANRIGPEHKSYKNNKNYSSRIVRL